MKVRTRFAPSPTGYLHVGSVRTALFSWLYTRHHNGEFVLRIEDTDQERSTKEAVEVILEGMEWMGLHPDIGPIYQTNRYERYKEVVQYLLENNMAYRCECSRERLEALREQQMANKEKPRYDGHCRNKNLPESKNPHVIRFRNPQEGIVSFHDEVYGDIHVSNEELDDLILIRSDGHPTYNFAVVVDDWDMEISHVIRGDDHISNTPRQINLFKALNAPVPIYAHLPMILGDDGKRLSKRHGAVSVLEFRNMGVLPEALLNYLVRLGWSSGDQEIFSVNEMIEKFELKNISRGVSSFNYEKLYWLNQHYQRLEPTEQTLAALQWQFERAGIDYQKGPSLRDIIKVQAERCKTLVEMVEKSKFFFQDSIEYDSAAVKKYLRPVILEPLETLMEHLRQTKDWNNDSLQQIVNDVCAAFDLNMGKVAQPLRVAITGSSTSPSIDMTLYMIGRERCLHRLQDAVQMIKQRAADSEGR